MIYYFSGNGNSKWVAEQIAGITNDRIINIAEYIRRGRIPEAPTDEEHVGIVFPTHAWYAPQPVLDFVSQLQIDKGTYCFAVCTCGDDAGKGMKRFAKHFDIDAAWSVVMPNTYIPMFNLDSDKVALRKIKKAQGRIEMICKCIKNKKKVWNVHEGLFPLTKTYILHPLFDYYNEHNESFHIDGECNMCGTCVNNCPMGNIILRNGKPMWDDKCIHCMGCVHSCPIHIIEYGKKTKKRGRYNIYKYLKQTKK